MSSEANGSILHLRMQGATVVPKAMMGCLILCEMQPGCEKLELEEFSSAVETNVLVKSTIQP